MNLLEQEILEQAINNLRKQINDCNIVVIDYTPKCFDATIQIGGIDFMCKIKGNITNANFNSILLSVLKQKEDTQKPILLVAKQIYPGLMKQLSEHDINVIDYAGNCIIRHEPLFLIIKGEKNTPVKEPIGRAFQEAGIKLIFHFLRNPDSVKQTYRTIKDETGISLGTIKTVIDELEADNFILKTKEGRFLKNKQNLLSRWIDAYNRTLKPKLLLNRLTFLSKDKQNKWEEVNLPKGMYWGGENGSHILDDYLYPGEFTIYTQIAITPLLKQGFFIPKKDGEIKVYNKFWNEETEGNIVPPLLIYADLMGSGNSRCLEAAQRILDNELRNLK